MAKGTKRTDRGPGARGRPGAAAVVQRVPVRIRAAGQGDAVALVALRRQLEGAHAHLLPDYFRVPGAPALDWPIFDRTSVILLAEEENSETPAASGGARAPVWGYVSVKLVETPADPAMTPCRRAHIDAVVVDAARRGGGIGTALMRAAATWARRQEAAELVLTVWSDNEAAEALYRRLGYRPIARVLRHVLES